MLYFDVNNGIARRAWARNEGAVHAISRAQKNNPMLTVTMPHLANDNIIDQLF
jgi:urocanate hydratase